MTIEERNVQLTETNQLLLNCCTDVIRKLAMDPEAEISSLLGLMMRHDDSRRTIMREKRRITRNVCEKFEISRRINDALA